MESVDGKSDGAWPRLGVACRALVFLFVVSGALWSGPLLAADVRTVLDLKGQIIAIVDADGSVATYAWDLAGNLTGITRISPGAGPVAITLVSPNQGLPNDAISLYGKGLANPSNVTFNGVAATIQNSSANHIAVTVPVTATTGILHVVTPLGQADSPSAFTVLSGGLTITPGNAAVLPTRTVQFTASGLAEWLVNGILNGAPETGTISGGLYTAPGSGVFPRQVTVAAQTPGNPNTQAEAVVTILPPPGARARGVSGTRGPAITAVSPAKVAQGDTNVGLTLTGQGLASPTALQFLKDGANDPLITPTNLAANGAGTQATATLPTVGGTPGPRVLQITVSTGGGSKSSTPAGTGSNVLTILPTFLPVYRGGICVADGMGACIGGDARAEAGLGSLIGYMRSTTAGGTVAVYRAACHSDPAGTCTGWSLSLDVNGEPVGYLATTAPASGNAPLRQSGGLLLQGLGGTPSAYLWTNPP